MTTKLDIGDRHLRHLDGFEDATRTLSVRIVVGDVFAQPSAQHVVACLANLLARLAGTVSRVQVMLPPGPWHVPMGWSGGARSPAESLTELATWATGGEVPISVGDDHACDLTICVGPRPTNFSDSIDLCVFGSGWRAWAGDETHLPTLPPQDLEQRNPLGPYLAACLGAGEVFKRARCPKRGAIASDFGYSLWTGLEGAWPTLGDGPPLCGMILPPLYIVGAGAVGQSLHAILAAAELHAAHLITIDDDIHDGTNLNRCVLAGIGDVERPKTEVITRCRKAAGLDGLEFQGTLAQYVRRSSPAGLRAEVAALEADDRYPIVISAVDKNTSRQDIQGLAPDLVIGGSTVGLSAKSNVYDGGRGSACLGCHNPPEDDGARLREVEQRVRTMSEVELREYLDGQVEEIERVIAYLQGAEKCGSVGEAQFQAFATKRDKEFSVSFVSMTAAVLLTARLFHQLAPATEKRPRHSMSTLAFRNLAAGDDALSKDSSCQRCGGKQATLREN